MSYSGKKVMFYEQRSGSSTPTGSDGSRTPPRRNVSWSESSGSPRSGSPASIPKDGFYAGAKFSESPSPRSLPMPPTRWLPKAEPRKEFVVMELELKKLLGIGN